MDNFRRTLSSTSSGSIDPTTGRGTIGNYEVVDLGLSNGLLFATCNVGAATETGYGDYYMYGKGTRKYNSSDSIYQGTENPLDSSVDTATQELGEGWRMPTQWELQDLINKTNYTWVTNFNGSGINGGKFTSKTNSNAYVFFPAAGYCSYSSLSNKGSNGYVWSSTPNDSLAYHLYFDSRKSVNYNNRRYGFSVRGVHDPI